MPRADMLGGSRQDLLFRDMTAADIPAGLQLCRLSRWNQLAVDWQLFLRLSPNGCRVAERGGEVVGTVATIRFGDRFSWLSMLLVAPAERNRGIGTQLLREGLAILANESCCRLDATPAGRPMYSKHSFLEQYSFSRMTGVIESGNFKAGSATSTRPMRSSDLDEIADWDLKVFGADRSELLLDLFNRAPEYAHVVERDGRIRGYLLGRFGFLYDQLGPIVAEDEADARTLVAGCLRSHGGKRFAIDVSRVAPGWVEWLMSIGFAEERVLVRMYRGENRCPEWPKDQFAVTGPEFG
jgi:GNAT superfamily N-acetyltransferase